MASNIPIRRWLVTGLTLLAVVSCGLPLLAQGQGDRPSEPPRPVQVVAHFLELDEAQRQAWGQILGTLHDTVRPLAADVAAREAELQELLAAADPGPGAVGRLLLEIRSLRQEIGAAQATARADFEALLGEEQTNRLRTLRNLAPLTRVLPAFRALHLL